MIFFMYLKQEGMETKEMRKLLIADCNEDYRTALSAVLQEHYHVLCCRTGTEARTLLEREQPDIFVLDLMLPELDGVTLLERISAKGIHPMVLAATPIFSDYVFTCAQRLGIEYLIRKPCAIEAIVSRVLDLSQRLKPQKAETDPTDFVTNLLLSLDISTKHNGFGYLRESILLIAKDPTQSVTKVIYPEVARICGCNKGSVERSIRTAIQNAWQHRDDQVWQTYFPPGPDGIIPKPTNAAFLSRLADSLLLHQSTQF